MYNPSILMRLAYRPIEKGTWVAASAVTRDAADGTLASGAPMASWSSGRRCAGATSSHTVAVVAQTCTAAERDWPSRQHGCQRPAASLHMCAATGDIRRFHPRRNRWYFERGAGLPDGKV